MNIRNFFYTLTFSTALLTGEVWANDVNIDTYNSALIHVHSATTYVVNITAEDTVESATNKAIAKAGAPAEINVLGVNVKPVLFFICEELEIDEPLTSEILHDITQTNTYHGKTISLDLGYDYDPEGPAVSHKR